MQVIPLISISRVSNASWRICCEFATQNYQGVFIGLGGRGIRECATPRGVDQLLQASSHPGAQGRPNLKR